MENKRNTRTKNEIIYLDDHAEIVLYNNKCEEIHRALIDLEDVNKISIYKWRFTHGYANHRMSGIQLQNLIMDFISNSETVVDHINRNRLDCRKENLRIVTYFVNAFNKGIQSNNTSGTPGVRYDEGNSDRWIATIKVNHKNIHLGSYKTKEEAIFARQQGELEYFGEIVNRKYDCNTVFKKDE